MARTRTLTDPGPADARGAVREGLDSASVVTVFGRCEVDYDGRATSYLGPGDRMVVCKPDGTLLVHTNEQRTPVNWQPPGCEHEVTLRGGDLALTSERENPDERVEIGFERVDAVVVYAMEDVEELELSGTEEDLRRRVLDEPALVEAGFEPAGTEFATGAGAADIVGEDREGTRVVVELKRRRVGPTAAGQLRRYVDALERDGGEPVRGVLVAPSVTDGAHTVLEEEGLEFVSLEP
jgi:RecB family endonuclease NucS